MHLQARGYDVVTLDSPFGFGAAVTREQPDLVLVDANMPALHGGKLVEVALQKGICSCPIVFHSDRSPRELQSLVLSSGASGFIQKTNDGDELAAQVEQFLNGTWQKAKSGPDSLRASTAPPASNTRVEVRSDSRPDIRAELRTELRAEEKSRMSRTSDAPPVSQRGMDMPPLSQRTFDAAPMSQRNPDAAPVSQRTVTSSNGWVRGKF